MRLLLAALFALGCSAPDEVGRVATFRFSDSAPDVLPVQTAESLRGIVLSNCEVTDMQGTTSGCSVVADNGRDEVTLRFTDKRAFFDVAQRCLSWERCEVTDDYGTDAVWGN